MAEYIEGKKISGFETVQHMVSSDLFLVSVPKNTYCLNYYRNNALTYQCVLSSTMEQILDGLELKNMAWEDENAYSRINHIHDYSRVRVDSHYTNGSLYDDLRDDRLCVLVNVMVDGSNNPISFSKIQKKKIFKTPIGTLKFMALPKLGRINVQSFDFDGWVYPDGRELNKTDFPEAYEEFGDYYKLEGDSADKFRIPTFENFIELNPFVETESSKYLQYQVGMKEHSHGYNLSTVGSVTASSKIYIGSQNWNEEGIHKGDIRYGVAGQCVESTVMLSSDSLKLNRKIHETLDVQGEDCEQYPDHNLLPVLMYIGTNDNPTGHTDCKFVVVNENDQIITIDGMYVNGQRRNCQYLDGYIYVDVDKNVNFELKLEKNMYHTLTQTLTYDTLNNKRIRMESVSVCRFNTVNGILQTLPKIDVDDIRINGSSIQFSTEGTGKNIIMLEKTVPQFQLTVTKDGFYDYNEVNTYQTLNGKTIPLVPKGNTRIVLTWNQEPRDLDSHCLIYNGQNKMGHIFFRNKQQYTVDLDVDCVRGYGPETTTIMDENLNYNYVFRVHLYAGVGDFRDGKPKVNVYGFKDEPQKTIEFNEKTKGYIPGCWWNVFEIVNGTFIPLNVCESGEKGDAGCTQFPELSHF